MPPQSHSPSLYLSVQPQTFFLAQLKANESLPRSVLERIADPLSGSHFLSVTRTKDEVSIISDFHIDGGAVDATQWRCFRVAGPLDLGLTGIMNDLTAPLKIAKIPVFVMSTWDTDWLLVPTHKHEQAVDALTKDGWVVRE